MENYELFFSVVETPIDGLNEPDSLSGQHFYVVRQVLTLEDDLAIKDIERLILANIIKKSYRKMDEIMKIDLKLLINNEDDKELSLIKNIFSKSNGKYFPENFSRVDKGVMNWYLRSAKNYYTKVVEDCSDWVSVLSLREESKCRDGSYSKTWSECFLEANSKKGGDLHAA